MKQKYFPLFTLSLIVYILLSTRVFYKFLYTPIPRSINRYKLIYPFHDKIERENSQSVQLYSSFRTLVTCRRSRRENHGTHFAVFDGWNKSNDDEEPRTSLVFM